MRLHEEYALRRIINAYDKATFLAGARVRPDVAESVHACLGDCFLLDELQEAAGKTIARETGAEWGCVTACAAAAITLGVAATMTGTDRHRISQLPDTAGMPDRVVIQAGHCVNFGAPVTQMIRLAGAAIVQAGTAESCRKDDLCRALEADRVAAVFAVESYHTSRYDGIPLAELAGIAHDAGVPLLVDAATQELRLRELVATGADLIGCSAHKYLEAPTAGLVAGNRDLVRALLLQHHGIGRGMKVGKEGIVGVLAAFKSTPWQHVRSWRDGEDRKVGRILTALSTIAGIRAVRDADPNACPFDRVRIEFKGLEKDTAGNRVRELKDRLARRKPAVMVRVYGSTPECVHLNTTELTDAYVDLLCKALREEIGRTLET